MNITHLKGLRFPDEYFIKFFYKFNFHQQAPKLRFLELGAANGCNLALPYQYHFPVIGVELDPLLVEYANHNFKLYNQDNAYDFIAQDMRIFCQEQKELLADILVLANSLYYIPKSDFIKLLEDLSANHLIQTKAPFFIRFRNLDDFRYNKGKKMAENTFILENGITGEDGALCVFYEADEMVTLLRAKLGVSQFQIMNIHYDNIQNDSLVNNSDVVVWGYVNL
ncbi:class I SAM-dependent methyltransferase [Legionella sp. km772]|uniref:class I SAM-dependent methyltransferase n=1 Tax=Legionella sp. km772 TaxID=2498111 RepID=UPI000F8E8B27|nr:class I SAM-dependent methyltransferase [Legionella sp. km772]RUR08124.1 class I SAM-dependent methyltransferase [Legionella sp. km772]